MTCPNSNIKTNLQETFASEKIEQTYIFLALLKVKLQILDIIKKPNTGEKKKKKKGRKKKKEGRLARGLGSSTQGGFPEFSFCLRYLRFKVDEASNPEVLTSADIKTPNRSLLTLVKGVGKGQPKKTENFQKIIYLLQPNTLQKGKENRISGPTHTHASKARNVEHNTSLEQCQRRQSREPGLPPHPAVGRHSSLGWSHRRTSGKSGPLPWSSNIGPTHSLLHVCGSRGSLTGC